MMTPAGTCAALPALCTMSRRLAFSLPFQTLVAVLKTSPMKLIRRRWELKIIVLVEWWTPCAGQKPAPDIDHAILEDSKPVLPPLISLLELLVVTDVEDDHSSDGDEEEHLVLGRRIFGDNIRVILEKVAGGERGRLQAGQKIC